MNITIECFKENEDGSADVSFNVDEEGLRTIFAFGVERMLFLAIENAQVKPIPDESDAR